MEDDTTAEADDGSTLAIDILHVVDVLSCLDTFLFTPSFDGLAKTRSFNQSAERTQTGDGLLNLCLVLCRTTAEFGHF